MQGELPLSGGQSTNKLANDDGSTVRANGGMVYIPVLNVDGMVRSHRPLGKCGYRDPALPACCTNFQLAPIMH